MVREQTYPQTISPSSPAGTQQVMVVTNVMTALPVDPAGGSMAFTDVPATEGATSDTVVATYVRNLKKNRVRIKELLYAADDSYRFYTVIDSRSSKALDAVFRAEAETQKELLNNEYTKELQLLFRHKNLASDRDGDDEEYLQDATFVRLSV